jgi:hypothetical protein
MSRADANRATDSVIAGWRELESRRMPRDPL